MEEPPSRKEVLHNLGMLSCTHNANLHEKATRVTQTVPACNLADWTGLRRRGTDIQATRLMFELAPACTPPEPHGTHAENMLGAVS